MPCDISNTSVYIVNDCFAGHTDQRQKISNTDTQKKLIKYYWCTIPVRVNDFIKTEKKNKSPGNNWYLVAWQHSFIISVVLRNSEFP